MLKIVFLLKKKPGMSRDDFISHYETSHAVLGKKLFGHLWVKYVRSYPKGRTKFHPEDYNAADDYDAVTEIWLEDEAKMAEMGRLMADPENSKLVSEDEEKFQDRSKIRFLIVDEVDNGTIL